MAGAYKHGFNDGRGDFPCFNNLRHWERPDSFLWTNRWIDGCSPKDLAPDLYSATPPARRLISVRDGLDQGRWITDLRGSFSASMIFQFCALWVAMKRTRGSMTEEQDKFRWIWTESGVYSAKTAYLAFFEGKTSMPGAEQLWTSKAPLRMKFFGCIR